MFIFLRPWWTLTIRERDKIPASDEIDVRTQVIEDVRCLLSEKGELASWILSIVCMLKAWQGRCPPHISDRFSCFSIRWIQLCDKFTGCPTEMMSSDLIDRKYYSLYIRNVSGNIRPKEVRQYLERFGPVDQCVLFEANHRRCSCSAFVLMHTPGSINRLMASRPHFLDGRRLVLCTGVERTNRTNSCSLTRLYFKRALPNECSNKIEHLLTSENVLIRFKADLEQPVIEPDFNEENVRNYFQGYGSIVNLLPLKTNCFVIEFNDYGKFTRLSNAYRP